MSDNITERIVVVDGGDVEQLDKFEIPKKLFIGRAKDIKAGLSRSLPTAYEGCMSGAKAIYQPHATTTKRFRKSIELDIFKMMDEQKAQDNNQQRNPTGDLPATECGSTLRTPGEKGRPLLTNQNHIANHKVQPMLSVKIISSFGYFLKHF